MSEQTIAIGDTEKAKLQKMQNKICRVSKVFGCCFGKDGKRLTEMSGNTEDENEQHAFDDIKYKEVLIKLCSEKNIKIDTS